MFLFDHARRDQTLPLSLRRGGPGQHDIATYYALDAKERQQTDVPPVWKYTLDQDVLDALALLSHDKCPFKSDGIRILLPPRICFTLWTGWKSRMDDASLWD